MWIMTANGWRQLQPRNCIQPKAEHHEYRQPLIEYTAGKDAYGRPIVGHTTQAAIDYCRGIRAELNGSREARGLEPIVFVDWWKA